MGAEVIEPGRKVVAVEIGSLGSGHEGVIAVTRHAPRIVLKAPRGRTQKETQMAHRNSPLSHALLSAFVVLLAGVGAQGCAAEDVDEVSATTGALYDQTIRLAYTDTRAAPSFNVRVEAADRVTGKFIGGSVNVPGGMVPPTQGLDFMHWTQDGLTQQSTSEGLISSIIYIIDRSASGHQFTNTRVTVTATINGACHTDWENIAFGGNNHLEFTGWGGTWNGTCYVGNLLSTHTPFSGP